MVESIEELKKICHNGARFTDRPWWYRIYRIISIRLTRLIIFTGIIKNPTLITLFEVSLGVSGPFFLLSSNIGINLIGFVFLFSAYLFDCMDGELARYYKRFSAAGSYLDEVGHAIIDPLLFVILSLNIYFSNPNTMVMILGFLAAFLIRFIKTSSQIKPYMFMKELSSTASRFKEEVQEEVKKTGKTITDRVQRMVNTLKHYVITVFIFFLAFLLDYLKGSLAFIPFLDYKLLVLIFYSVFLTLVAVAQVLLYMKTIDKDNISLLKQVMEAVKK